MSASTTTQRPKSAGLRRRQGPRRHAGRRRHGKARSVGKIATGHLVTIDSDAPLSGAARLMAERRTAHLVAVQPGTDQPAGVLSASGLATVLAWGRS